jgi:hypothetical protein
MLDHVLLDPYGFMYKTRPTRGSRNAVYLIDFSPVSQWSFQDMVTYRGR